MFKKRIPTIIGLLLLILGTVGGVVFINKGTNFLPRAAPEYAPQKVKITNLSDNGFVVSWITQEPTVGFLRFGNSANNLSTTVTDDRDQLTGVSADYRTHYISIQNLEPITTYYFKLGSLKDQLYDNNGQPFAITTPNIINSTPPIDTIYGTVITPANTPAEGSLVYLTLSGATQISALVKQNGNWATNLSVSRASDLASYISYDAQRARIDISVQSGSGEPTVGVTTTNNDQPVPAITLGQSFDYSITEDSSNNQSTDSTPVEPTTSPDSRLSLQPVDIIEDSDETLTITSIPADGTEVNTSQPEITGSASANSTIIISVHSPTGYTDQVQVDSDGNWQWTPPADLEPGEHTVTVSYTDTDGILHKLSRIFVVNAASSDNPNYSATPSATPTTTPKPSPTPTATPTPKPIATPTPTPIDRTTVATTSAILNAGTVLPTIYGLIIGFLLVALGWKTLLPRR